MSFEQVHLDERCRKPVSEIWRIGLPLLLAGIFLVCTGPAAHATSDGPAQLPIAYVQTAMANTPAPGTTILVSAGGSLQTALNNAKCGDTIKLAAGATFSGVF